jgi:hypothetical protein
MIDNHLLQNLFGKSLLIPRFEKVSGKMTEDYLNLNFFKKSLGLEVNIYPPLDNEVKTEMAVINNTFSLVINFLKHYNELLSLKGVDKVVLSYNKYLSKNTIELINSRLNFSSSYDFTDDTYVSDIVYSYSKICTRINPVFFKDWV